MDGNTTYWRGLGSGNQFSIFANKTSDKLIIGNFVKRSLSSGLKGIDWTQKWHYWQLTQEGDIDQGVPGGRWLEVHPAPVHPGLGGSDVLNHEGRGPAEVKVGAVPEHELVTPPRPLVPTVLTCVVAEERKVNEYGLYLKCISSLYFKREFILWSYVYSSNLKQTESAKGHKMYLYQSIHFEIQMQIKWIFHFPRSFILV